MIILHARALIIALLKDCSTSAIDRTMGLINHRFALVKNGSNLTAVKKHVAADLLTRRLLNLQQDVQIPFRVLALDEYAF